MNLISRKDAKQLGLLHYYTGLPCKRGGHITKRLVSASTCCECIKENHYTYYAGHRQQALDIIKKWSINNKEKVNTATQNWRINNPTKAKEVYAKYYSVSKSKLLAYNKIWRQLNKAKIQIYNVKRRHGIQQATPPWINKDDINSIVDVYKKSVQLTMVTGVLHHVDHIIPISSKIVCGLHVPWNLQAIPATDNLQKNNKLI